MSNDKELLELAAKAALGRTSIPNHAAQLLEKGWNPLEKEEDAFRLSVRLGMSVKREPSRAVVSHASISAPVIVEFIAEDCGEYLGTMRAIVRAAAEIGRAMP